MIKLLSENYELKITNVVTKQIKQNYQGIVDPLGLAPSMQDIEQKAETDEEVESEIEHDKWMNRL